MIGADYHISTAAENHRKNFESSQILKLPPEIHRNIIVLLFNTVDLKRFSHTCKTFYFLVNSRDYYASYLYSYKTWTKEYLFNDINHLDISWKCIVLKDHGMRQRIQKNIFHPISSTTGFIGRQMAAASSSSSRSTLSSDLPDDISSSSALVSNPASTQSQLPLAPIPVPEPTEVQSSPSTGGDNSDMELDFNLNNDIEYSLIRAQKKAPPVQKAPLNLRVLLDGSIHFKPDPTSTAEGWRQMGSPVYHIDESTNSIIAASMLMRPDKGKYLLDNRRILLYKLPDLSNPIAVCPSKLWSDNSNSNDVSHLMDIRHYPDTIDANGNMRIVMVIVFGSNARPASQDDNEMQILDIWKLVRIVEMWLPVGNATTSLQIGFLGPSNSSPWVFKQLHDSTLPVPPILEPRPGAFEIIDPGRGETELRGRIAKLYRAPIPKAPKPTFNEDHVSETDAAVKLGEGETEMADCIAIFGIQNTDMSSAIVIKKVLFLKDKKRGYSSFSKKQISRLVSCMALFPYYSNYERMLVLFNRHGRGLIWDWVNEKQIAQLHMKIDNKSNKESQEEDDPGAKSRLYYWGAQVNWALEVPYSARIKSRGRQLFRIVIMSDGERSEWESTWWHVDSTILGEAETGRDLLAPPFIPLGQRTPWKAPPGETKIIYAEAKRYEYETVGHCLEEQASSNGEEHGKPLLFIAYVIWNHFRIVLTSKLGLAIYDMNDGQVYSTKNKSSDQQWVTFLDDAKDNPLVDIATVGDNLVITRRFGQLIWPFYRDCQDEKY